MTVSRPVYVLKITVMGTKVMKRNQQIETELPQSDHLELRQEDLQGINQPQEDNLLTN